MYPKYLELYLENLQLITNKNLEIFFQTKDYHDIITKIFTISFNLMKLKFEEDHFATENEKNLNDTYLMRASTILHNISFFCYDEFNLRYSVIISENIKNFLMVSRKIFEESIKFFFEIGLNFPNSTKKQNIVINALFPLIVLNPAVYQLILWFI